MSSTRVSRVSTSRIRKISNGSYHSRSQWVWGTTATVLDTEPGYGGERPWASQGGSCSSGLREEPAGPGGHRGDVFGVEGRALGEHRRLEARPAGPVVIDL